MSSIDRRTSGVGVLLLAVACLATACVTGATHDAVVNERDLLARESNRLATELSRMDTANQSLSAERLELIDELETIRDERDVLRVEATELGTLSRSLSASLDASQAEAESNRVEVDRLQATYQGLVSDLESEVAAGQIEIEQLREGVRVNVSDDILFASGSARLDKIGRALLDKVAERLVGGDYLVEVQGHTDNIAIRGVLAKRYPTNWELASARASSVVRLFQQAGVEGERMTAVSHAEYQPVALNETEEDRWRNRRIEIRLHPVAAVVEVEQFEPSESPSEP